MRSVLFMCLFKERLTTMSKTAILTDYGDFLSADDLSEIFGISKQTIYKEIRAGKFGSYMRFGREYRVPKIHIVQKCLGEAVGNT